MNIINGILATTLALSGGASLSLFSANDNPVNPNTVNEEQGIDYDQMTDMMGTETIDSMSTFMEDGNVNSGQMKPYMSEMHSNLDNYKKE